MQKCIRRLNDVTVMHNINDVVVCRWKIHRWAHISVCRLWYSQMWPIMSAYILSWLWYHVADQNRGNPSLASIITAYHRYLFPIQYLTTKLFECLIVTLFECLIVTLFECLIVTLFEWLIVTLFECLIVTLFEWLIVTLFTLGQFNV